MKKVTILGPGQAKMTNKTQEAFTDIRVGLNGHPRDGHACFVHEMCQKK